MADDSAPIDIQLVDKIAPTIAPKIEAIAAAARDADDAMARLNAQMTGLSASKVDALTASVTKQNLAYLQEERALNLAVKAETEAQFAHVKLQQTVSGTSAVTKELVKDHEKLGISTLALREPFTLLREGVSGNYTRMIGSAALLAQGLGQLGNVVKALPFIGLVGALVAVETILDQDAVSTRKLQTALLGIGAVTGTSAQQLHAAAIAAQTYGNMSVTASQSLARAYLDSGKIGNNVLIDLTKYTTKYGIATDETAKEAQADLIKMFSDPTKGAEELNSKLGILTGTQQLQIEALQKSGDIMGAQKIILDALKTKMDALSGSVKDQTGFWENLGKAASNAIHAMVVAMGGGDLQEQLAQARSNLTRDQVGNAKTGFVNEAQVKSDADLVATLTKQMQDFNAAQNKTKADAKQGNLISLGKDQAQQINPDAFAFSNLQSEVTKAKNALDAANASGKENASTIAILSDTYNKAHDALGRVTDASGHYITQLQREHLEAALQDKIVSTSDRNLKGFYTRQLELLKIGPQMLTNQEALTKAQDAGNIVADKASKAGQGQIITADTRVHKLQDELANQEKINAAVASGALTIGQATQAISAYNRIAQFQAEVDQATGKQKAALLKIMPAMIAAQTALTASQKDFAQLKTNDEAQKANELLQTQIDLTGQDVVMRDLEIARVKTLNQLQKDNTDPNSDAGKKALLIAQDNVYLQQQNKISEIVNKLTDEYHDLQIQEAALVKEQSLGIISDAQFGVQMTQLRLKALNLGISLGKVTDANSLLTASFGKMLTGFNGVLPTLTDDFGNFFSSIEDGAGRAFGAVLTGSESAQQAIQQLSQSVLSDLIAALVKLGIQWAVQQALGDTLAATAVATSSVQASALAAAWEPAAMAVSIATFGAADAIGLTAYITAVSAGKLATSIPGFDTGGLIGGAGSGRSDSNLIRASRGEYIVNADATSKYLPLLEMLNGSGSMAWFHAGNAQIPQYANGGYVGGDSVGKPNVKIYNNYGPMDIDVQFNDDHIAVICDKQINKRVPKMLGSEMKNSNSPLSKGIERYTQARRNAGAT
jgi:hypothetical protein